MLSCCAVSWLSTSLTASDSRPPHATDPWRPPHRDPESQGGMPTTPLMLRGPGRGHSPCPHEALRKNGACPVSPTPPDACAASHRQPSGDHSGTYSAGRLHCQMGMVAQRRRAPTGCCPRIRHVRGQLARKHRLATLSAGPTRALTLRVVVAATL